MGSLGLERGFAVVTGMLLILLGVLGAMGSPLVGRPGTTGIIVTGFGHDLVHLVTGALFVHVGVALDRRQRAWGLVGLGVFFLVSGLLSLRQRRTSWASTTRPPRASTSWRTCCSARLPLAIGWMGRGVERREVGRAASRPLRS